jgi:hypothetical protein
MGGEALGLESIGNCLTGGKSGVDGLGTVPMWR